MATLKELYTTLKSLRDMNLPIDDKLTDAADKLEEKIIKEEILPALSENIEPQLSEIQRDLALVVEYHPGEPISVALSRKAKISDFIDAKPLTPYASTPVKSGIAPEKPVPHEPTKKVDNPTKGLKVTFPNGRIVWHTSAIDTLIETLRIIGFERVSQLTNTMHAGYPLVSHLMRPYTPGKAWQHECDGWYIYSNTNNAQKISDLRKISDFYHLNLRIEEVKPK